MTPTVRTAPPNSLLLLVGSDAAELPDGIGGAAVAATASCIAVGCLAAMDGATEVRFVDAAPDSGLTLAYRGTLSTPERRVRLETVNWDVLLDVATSGECTQVEVWTNDPSEPDHICVVLR